MSLLCKSLRCTIPQRKEAAIIQMEWTVSVLLPDCMLCPLNHFSDVVGQNSHRQRSVHTLLLALAKLVCHSVGPVALVSNSSALNRAEWGPALSLSVCMSMIGQIT